MKEKLHFFHDVLVTFAEDPQNAFAVKEYRHYLNMNGPLEDWYTGKWQDAYVKVIDDENKEFTLNLESVQKAFDILEAADPKLECVLGLHKTYRRNYHDAYRELDACMIDAYDAMCIMQLAMYGEVVIS